MSRRALSGAAVGFTALTLGLLPTSAGATGTAGATQAEAQAVSRIVNVATGRCLDSNAAGDVYTLGCNGGNYQRWEYDWGQVRNVATGRCLDSNVNGEVYTLACNGGNYQTWATRSNREIVNGQTLRCLDSNAAGEVYALACNGGNYQAWHG